MREMPLIYGPPVSSRIPQACDRLAVVAGIALHTCQWVCRAPPAAHRHLGRGMRIASISASIFPLAGRVSPDDREVSALRGPCRQ